MAAATRPRALRAGRRDAAISGEVVDARVIDLDDGRAARQEATGGPVLLRFGGRDVELPAEVSAEFVLLITEGNLRGAITSLLGDTAARAFFGWASMDDVNALVEHASKAYGLGQGE